MINYIDINGTWAGSIGINLNATFIYGISITGSLVFDGKGNVGFQFSHAGTQIKNLSCGVADVGVGFTPAIIWDAQTIYDLEGNSTQLGASFGPAWYLGADAIWLDGTKSALSELSVVVGLGIGADIHVNRPWTNDTLTVFGGNQWGGRRPSGATGADMSTARWLAGSYVINDVDRINMGWVDDVYGMIKYLYDLF